MLWNNPLAGLALSRGQCQPTTRTDRGQTGSSFAREFLRVELHRGVGRSHGTTRHRDLMITFRSGASRRDGVGPFAAARSAGRSAGRCAAKSCSLAATTGTAVNGPSRAASRSDRGYTGGIVRW